MVKIILVVYLSNLFYCLSLLVLDYNKNMVILYLAHAPIPAAHSITQDALV